MDYVLSDCIARATESDVRYFSFGICTESQNALLNEGLYGFKAEFGGAGIVHEFYECDLSRMLDATAIAPFSDGNEKGNLDRNFDSRSRRGV